MKWEISCILWNISIYLVKIKTKSTCSSEMFSPAIPSSGKCLLICRLALIKSLCWLLNSCFKNFGRKHFLTSKKEMKYSRMDVLSEKKMNFPFMASVIVILMFIISENIFLAANLASHWRVSLCCLKYSVILLMCYSCASVFDIQNLQKD